MGIKDKSKSLKVLTAEEVKEYYEVPEFSEKEREQFFSLDKENQIRKDDIEYILKRYFPKKQNVNVIVNKNTLTTQKAIIFYLFGCNEGNETYKTLIDRARQMSSVDINPKYLFKELVRYCYMMNIIVPSYRRMQKIISAALLSEEKRINKLLNSLLNKELKDELEKLLKKEEKSRYFLSTVRTAAKGFSYNQVKREIKKKEKIESIFRKAKTLLDHLEISNHSIKYYARLAETYTIYKLKRFAKLKRYLYLLCFIYHRYLKINDDLVKTFLYLINKYINDVKTLADEKILKLKMENKINLSKCSKLLELFTDDDLDNFVFRDVKEKAYSIMDKEKIKSLSLYLSRSTIEQKDFRWQEFDKKYDSIKKNMRPILSHLEFYSNKASANRILGALDFIKRKIESRKKSLKDIPTRFIAPLKSKFLYEKSKDKESGRTFREVLFHRYEIYVYKKLKNMLIAGDIFLEDSTEYRSLEDDLVDQSYFDENYNKILDIFQIPNLSTDFAGLINSLTNELEERIVKVNRNILNDKNPHFHYKKGKNKKYHWHFDYERVENKAINNTVFKNLDQIDLYDLLRFVERRVSFLEGFSHILLKNLKKEMKDNELLATIIAYGVNLGLRIMSKNSSIPYHTLKTTSSSYLREETLKLANE